MKVKWAVIGAGPAGIATVGCLLDKNYVKEDIAWIDPAFKVGDFGSLWRNVPSNTKVKWFMRFLHACKSFAINKYQNDFLIFKQDVESTCQIALMADVLSAVTEDFKLRVNCYQDFAMELDLRERRWHIKLKSGQSLIAEQVILATGAYAKQLDYQFPSIDLAQGLNPTSLSQAVQKNETIGVFGSSHSAILLLKNLIACGVHKVINFYRSPLRYAVELDDWILFDDTGLKGETADWARQYLDGELPENLIRVYSNSENILAYSNEIHKVIYAVGFERRELPKILGYPELNHLPTTGIIAPGLFGVGIGFPELKTNPLGIAEQRVGLWKFMQYVQKLLPIWERYQA